MELVTTFQTEAYQIQFVLILLVEGFLAFDVVLEFRSQPLFETQACTHISNLPYKTTSTIAPVLLR